MNQDDIDLAKKMKAGGATWKRLGDHFGCDPETKRRPKLFKDAYTALRAATDRLEAYLNTNMRRDGEALLGPRKRAEALFHQEGA